MADATFLLQAEISVLQRSNNRVPHVCVRLTNLFPPHCIGFLANMTFLQTRVQRMQGVLASIDDPQRAPHRVRIPLKG